jgi:peptidoglycan/xylan/chitin deacetylase (PgdA/CDA1 family)
LTDWRRNLPQSLTLHRNMALKLKHMLLCIGAGVLYYSGLLRLWFFLRRWASGNKRVCVIGLHRILNEDQKQVANSLQGIVMQARTFERMLEFLSRTFSVVSLDEFLNGALGAAKPACLLTFDDGWRDNFINALPRLKKLHLPAVIFAVTGFIEKREVFWVERLVEVWSDPTRRGQVLKGLAGLVPERDAGPGIWEIVEALKHFPARQRTDFLATCLPPADSTVGHPDEMLTWEEASALEEDGIAIEAHTVSHPLLVYEDEATVRRELADSKATLERKLGKKVRAFAYPNGSWNDRVRGLAREAGYDCAFTTDPGWYGPGEDAFSIRRIMLHEGRVTGWRGEFSPAVMTLRLLGGI